MMRRIGFLVYPTFDLLDLSGPLEVFQWAGRLVPGSYSCEVMALSIIRWSVPRTRSRQMARSDAS